MSLNSTVQLAETVDNPTPEVTQETLPESTTESNPISSQDLQDLETTIITLNNQITILNEKLSVCNTETGTLEVIDYTERLDTILNRQEIIATNSTIFIAGTGIILVLFILYSAIRKFVDY